MIIARDFVTKSLQTVIRVTLSIISHLTGKFWLASDNYTYNVAMFQSKLSIKIMEGPWLKSLTLLVQWIKKNLCIGYHL